MRSLAGQPGYSGFVISLCQFSRSRVSPAEQVGEHHGGAGGCLASFGSSGIAGHTTCRGCQPSSFDAQPVASSVSDSSISKRSGLFLSCIVCHLVGRFLAALLFGSVLGGRGGHRFGLGADLLSPLRLPSQIGDCDAVPVCDV
ncbi:Predicted polyphosphate- or ATP-dependent NAD kinase [Pseudomonas syringae pv. actinidiae]|uniref:Predicted polyphosphate-or ATP-dependent NAD kinase n=1 Tax=Pseudomonas syringae pv. actinidiae TaxID=103796 RepID=A0A2V0QRE4_PSESF|nr:Predicted polyphosphate- or ATP-dependent NAD kinase [Pseudomonas syringae pv. actinidiae]